MNKPMLVRLLISGTTAAAFLGACGGGGGGSSSDNTIKTTLAAPAISTTNTTIATATDAAKSANASKTIASSFASGTSFPSINALVGKPATNQTENSQKIITTVRDIKRQMEQIISTKKSLGKQVALIQSKACTGGGTKSYDDASDPLVLSFNNCYDNSSGSYQYRNGTITLPQSLMSSSSSTTGGTLSLNMTEIDYAYGGYTVKQQASVTKMVMSVSSFDSTAGTSSFSMNGSGSKIDYVANTSEKQAFGNFTLNMTESTSATSNTSDLSINGTVSMDTYKDATFTTIDTASGMAFKNLQLNNILDSSLGTNTLTINGIYAIKTIPACMDGTFAVSTQSPITTDSYGGTTGGQMTVNGIVIVFNSDGTATATINGIPQNLSSYANACSLSF
jgi:hypothetical protein